MGESRVLSIGEVARELGVSASHVRQLANEGRIPSTRTVGGHRRFELGAVRDALARCATQPAPDAALTLGIPTLQRTLELPGLQEHIVWRDVREALDMDMSTDAGHIAQYAFGEMMNNAIEHSQGRRVELRFWKQPSVWAFEIADDGIGAFERVRLGFGLKDELASIQQISKGKQTTDPKNHTGQGIFFTSKAVDLFQIAANGWIWTVDTLRQDQAVGGSDVTHGTTVLCGIDPATDRNLTALFKSFEIDEEFAKTKAVVKLFGIGTTFVSRSEARRLLERLEAFKVIELDFRGVEMVGQGFVDQVFRVWASDHPDIQLVPTNMAPAVEFMVRRGLPKPERE